MKTRSLFLFIFLIVFPASSFSQGYILKRALNRQIEREIDTILDKKVQDQQNKNRAEEKQKQAQQSEAKATTDESNVSTETEKEPRSSGASGGGGFAGLLGNKVDINHNDEYKFSSRMFSQMEMYDKKEVTKMDYYMYFSKNSPSAGIQTTTVSSEDGEVPVTAQMILDGENKCFIMLSDVNGMKIGMISEVPDSIEQTTGTQKPPVVNKTGNSKTILGFKCDEYLYRESDAKEYTKMWFTKETVLDVDKRAWTQSGMPSSYGYAEFEQGMILAWESYDKNNELTAKSEVKEINNDFSKTMSIEGYTLRQMNLNQKKK
jgi:hypothetical protein